MLYWLIALSDRLSVLNVFRYLTFRAVGAVVTALIFVFLFGPTIINLLRIKQGKGQPIRADGPESHLLTKTGTPTMGGLMILSGLLVSTLLWANLTNPYVWIVLAVTLCFGGFRSIPTACQICNQQFRRCLSTANESERLRCHLAQVDDHSRLNSTGGRTLWSTYSSRP